jgi:hypothetical protein
VAKTIHIAAENRLPDEGNWINRFRVKSSSSSTIHIVAQEKDKRHWACSCNGWTRRPVRECHHLKDLGIVGGLRPYDVRIESGGNPMTAEETAAASVPVAASRTNFANIQALGRRKIDL